MKPLEGKIAVVAGATRGAGRGIATALGEAGATVYCTGRSVPGRPGMKNRPETIHDTAELVTARGGRGIPVPCDLTDPSSLAALTAGGRRIDLCVAAQTAGVRFGARPLLEIDGEELDRGYQAYVRGTWNLLQAVGPRLLEQQARVHERRDRDRSQNADDRHHDHQLDECETALLQLRHFHASRGSR